ncbi:MAG: hypothetical protein OXU20_27515 [Myxococcales bacterium]|nr:hypothetical protein [Myxococcales bacterium]MDD9972002.1 hypothetical protein [Myxococcales bacterium]
MPRLAGVAFAVALLGTLVTVLSWQRGELVAVRQQLGVLESEVADLRARVEAGERPVPAPPAPASPPVRAPAPAPGPVAAPSSVGSMGRADPREAGPLRRLLRAQPDDVAVDFSRDAVASVVAALETDQSPVRNRFRKLVRDEQNAIWEERRARRQARWERRTSERLERLAEEADLTQAQVDALYGSMTAARDRIGEAFREARKENRFEDAHDQASSIRAEADAEARQWLDADQYEAYRQMREEQAQERRSRHRRFMDPPPDGQSEGQPPKDGARDTNSGG